MLTMIDKLMESRLFLPIFTILIRPVHLQTLAVISKCEPQLRLIIIDIIISTGI